MICYKCREEMVDIIDSAWRTHRDGSKKRITEWMCPECRVYASLEVIDFANVDIDDAESDNA